MEIAYGAWLGLSDSPDAVFGLFEISGGEGVFCEEE